jgi:uncharacterized protein (TIGR02646 family)
VRFIDTSGYRPPDGWQGRATTLGNEIRGIANRLREAAPENREAIRKELHKKISGAQALWTELKAALGQLSSNKCWYCESRETRSHMVIDHFRPKNRVKERTEHPGYWWLALAHSNFRYCCTLCNSLKKDEATGDTHGKSDSFPLFDEAARAFDIANNLGLEDPCLLDPTVAADVILLWFEEDGRVVPKYGKESKERLWLRAQSTIDVYNLNDPNIREARLVVARDVRDFVREGTKRFEAWADGGDQASRDSFEVMTRKVGEMITPTAEFSSAARAILAGMRGVENDWVDLLLQRV